LLVPAIAILFPQPASGGVATSFGFVRWRLGRRYAAGFGDGVGLSWRGHLIGFVR